MHNMIIIYSIFSFLVIFCAIGSYYYSIYSKFLESGVLITPFLLLICTMLLYKKRNKGGQLMNKFIKIPLQNSTRIALYNKSNQDIVYNLGNKDLNKPDHTLKMNKTAEIYTDINDFLYFSGLNRELTYDFYNIADKTIITFY
jgi:hypothetical protein